MSRTEPHLAVIGRQSQLGTHNKTMKTLLYLSSVFILVIASAFGQAGFTAVMVNTNGVVQRPTNFFVANNINTNQPASNTVTFPVIINQVNRIDFTANQWTSITNVASFTISDGRMVLVGASTNSGNFAVAHMGENVNGHSILNLDSSANIKISDGSGLIFQGALGNYPANFVARFVIRGVSASGFYDNVGSLDRAGWAVEIRTIGGTNQARLLVFASGGLETGSWTAITNAINTPIKTLWTWRDATNTYAKFIPAFGTPITTNAPDIIQTNVAGGSAGLSGLSIGIAGVNTNTTASGAYMDIAAIYETMNFNP